MKRDEQYMRRCFELALGGAGQVSPNPLVGAVLVKRGKIIGEGWHERYGQAHAEVNAFARAVEDAAGADLYCNLEPCCHVKKQTPPCVPLIIQKKVRRVIISNLDPNPQVAGQGVQMLREAGIKVETNVREAEGERLNRFYFTAQRHNRPFITLKIAQSLDGKISKSQHSQTWLTGEESRRFVHGLRAAYDAALVGANTIRTDNPRLTVRHAAGRNPIRIILDGRLSIPPQAEIIRENKDGLTWILTSAAPAEDKKSNLKPVRIHELPASEDNRIHIPELVAFLHGQRLNSLLVEGGQSVFTQFIAAGFFDELIILQAPVILGSGIPAFEGLGLTSLRLDYSGTLGNDLKLVYRRE
jgi:diaminohydroxyphosphoribosylaminopyrimidine deaminase/5-amino-6-(5-phosphoribosylamino)uracil reductase